MAVVFDPNGLTWAATLVSLAVAIPPLAGLAPLVGRATGQSMHSDPSHTIFDEMRSELQKLWNLCFTPKERHL